MSALGTAVGTVQAAALLAEGAAAGLLNPKLLLVADPALAPADAVAALRRDFPEAFKPVATPAPPVVDARGLSGAELARMRRWWARVKAEQPDIEVPEEFR
jgi:uncharacterized protein (DUF934 family)